MKRAIRAAMLVAGLGATAGAQIIRPTIVQRPSMYTSFSVGWLSQMPICDPTNDACWTFGDAAQYRVAFEKPISLATSVGFSYSHAAVPLRWADAACAPCNANSEMHQLMGILHLGGTGAFTQLIDIAAGATRFANFKQSSNGAPLGTGKPVTDFSFGIAYGFGVRMTPALYFTLQEEYGVVFHRRMPGATSGAAEQRTMRAGLRLAM